ncbi:hypothetical protein [Halovenus sp. HT40]|uniref:hypothetical protein n=1 Tax=Halovenus sp. HT40 TaxID=3126691 RepID=UPI00300EC810
MAVHLTNVAGTEHIYLHADDAHGVKSAYDQLHAPVVLNKEPTERMDLRDLIEQANPEATLQIAEYSVSATPQSDRLLTEESTCPGTGESTNLMIDLIRADLQAAEVDTGVQILIRGRESDESALQSKQQSIANGYDRGFYGNLKVEGSQRIDRALSDSSDGQNNRVDSSETCNPEKRKKCKQTDGNNTFDIVVRMLACVPEGRALIEADYVFNTIGQRLEKATTDEIEIKKTVYTEGETNYVKRDFSTVSQQLLEREHYGGRGLLRTHIPRVTNTPEIVADSRTIWNWCLPTTETTESARRQTRPRDQNPTDRPPESVLDELTRDSDRSSRSNDDHHDSNA